MERLLVALGSVQMVRIARRAPGSADMRAALAALYWQVRRHARAIHTAHTAHPRTAK